VPYAVLAVLGERPTSGTNVLSETIAAVTLALSALYIVINETMANWQALWLGAVLLLLAASLAPALAARSS
jgi:glucan 1,3-beta-glucosidase